MEIDDIRSLFSQPEYTRINRYFADFMLKLSGSDHPGFYLACGLLSHRVEQGDVCLDLAAYADGVSFLSPDDQPLTIQFPDIEAWVAALQANPVVGEPGDRKPLILDAAPENPRLYLYRSWQYEHRLADYIREARSRPVSGNEIPISADEIGRLFPESGSGAGSQASAAETALASRFCVITGGPGTGKTTTVFRIIRLLLKQAGDTPFRIALAAPTGKAANRLGESIRASLRGVTEDGTAGKAVLSGIPTETVTIHRLLGNIANSPRFRHDSANPLPHDCVIIDEASMVDLALMSKLVDALKPDCRLILLGDRNQLSSVESGSVLADICAAPSEPFAGQPPGADGIVNLTTSYRFDDDSTIGRLSRNINAGEAEAAIRVIDGAPGDISRSETPPAEQLKRALAENLLAKYRSRLALDSVADAFRELSEFCIISALRNGPAGSLSLNRMIEQILRENRVISGRDEWYRGRPVMMTRNDYQLELYNGDVGIVLPDAEDGRRLKVFFQTGPGQFRSISPFRLPEHETAYAMTIHKSQGSEFNRVLMILPGYDTPLLTRELIYTGITRARQSVEIWGNDDILRQAINRRTSRSSGLAKALYG